MFSRIARSFPSRPFFPLTLPTFPNRSFPLIQQQRTKATLNRIIRKGLDPIVIKPRAPALDKCPQKKSVVLKLFALKPKKPNSAQRKCARVRMSNGRVVIAYIPGEGHNLQEHSVVLVRGGHVQDCPGVRYKVVRGALDCQGVVGRVSSRSKVLSICFLFKYGTKKVKAEK